MVDNDFSIRSYADLQGLDRLKQQAKGNGDPKALEAVAKQFESLFLNMLLKNMREANRGFSEGGLFDSSQSRFYQDMFDQELSVSLASGKGIGLSEMLVKQLTPKASLPQPDPQAASGTAFNHALDQAARAAVAAMVRRQGEGPGRELKPGENIHRAPVEAASADATAVPERFDSPQAFVEGLYPTAKRVSAELGVDPEVLLAQAALETGWGQHLPHNGDGRNSYNLFGIKADGRWQGDRALVNTLEFKDGVARQEKAAFRSYGSYEESLRDYVDFIKTEPRYRPALDQAQDPRAYLEQLQLSGYATDPEYARKITGILGGDLLLSALAKVKES